ncbi:PROTEIN KINASE PLANT-TYPE putative-RELATED [Salix koriyanagi]|uniref:PROTEIN KINASE PLANT-TYPE putative-RELATED n=1 Tax=Salix koriyanagi TaxID=2511006 RepID=A0A9Q0SMX7_9ROSI|nr:PROTEIN KINASE PLANT-TYPE putative-RELATED [Salix koriyanagi]
MAFILLSRCVAVFVFLLSSQSALPVRKAAALSLYTDKEALLSFKSQVTIDPLNTLSSWNSSSSPCNWTRVSCSQVNQRVIGLDLSGLRLTGSVSPHIGNLSFLRSLHLQENQFAGVIPDQIGSLSRLSVLNMSHNSITGPIPLNLTKCLNLQILDLMQNEISGVIPEELSSLKSLEILNLGKNNLSGLGNLPELQMYNIGYNLIKSSGDEGLNFLTSLVNSSHLNFLAIDGNLLEGPIPESIGNLSSSLRSLYLGGNRIHGRIPASIRHLRSLALLNISYNYVSGEIPPEIGELTNLQELHLAANKMSGRIPNSLGKLQKLNAIDLSANELLTGPLPQEIKGLQNVAAVDFSHNHLTGSIPDTIGSWKSLEKLFMDDNMFSGAIPATLGDVKGLEILDLSSNQISGMIPNNLEKLQALQLLNLSFNDLEGLLPQEGAFRNLSRIHVEGNSKLCVDLTCWNNQHGKKTSTAIYIVIASIAAVAVCSVIAVLLCVVDPELLLSIQDSQPDARFTSPGKQRECLISVLGVGLSRTADSPDQRADMRDSLQKLKTARDTLLRQPLDHKPDLDLEAGIGESSMNSF